MASGGGFWGVAWVWEGRYASGGKGRKSGGFGCWKVREYAGGRCSSLRVDGARVYAWKVLEYTGGRCASKWVVGKVSEWELNLDLVSHSTLKTSVLER